MTRPVKTLPKATQLVIRKQRNCAPHSDLLYGAKALLKLSEDDDSNRNYLRMAAILLCAFSFEGYLNSLGRKLMPRWESFERKYSWNDKAKLIAETLGAPIDAGKEPFQTIKQIFQFRDKVAHPKPENIERELPVPKSPSDFFQIYCEYARSEMEAFCIDCDMRHAIKCVEKLIGMLDKLASGFDVHKSKH